MHYETSVPREDRLIPLGRTLKRDEFAAAQMLDFFHLSKDGRHYRRIVEGFKRIFAATIFFGTEDQPSSSRLIDWARFHFFEHMRLWFAQGDAEEPEKSDEGNVITLTEAFYHEISKHPIPVEREVVAAFFSRASWISTCGSVWKSWSLRGRTARIPLLGPNGLTEQLGNSPYTVERTFRLTVSRWLRTVKALWPACPASDLRRMGTGLIVRSSTKSFAICRRTCEKASSSAPSNSRVSCYTSLALIFKGLGQMARVSCYKATCFLLRFHVYPATQSKLNTQRFNQLGGLPVLPVVIPCKKIPVVGQDCLWKSARTTSLPASLAERRYRTFLQTGADRGKSAASGKNRTRW